MGRFRRDFVEAPAPAGWSGLTPPTGWEKPPSPTLPGATRCGMRSRRANGFPLRPNGRRRPAGPTDADVHGAISITRNAGTEPATNEGAQTWQVTGDDEIKAVTALVETLDFVDLL